MSDLVQRLRLVAEGKLSICVADEAADEIERLRAALEEIANLKNTTVYGLIISRSEQIAREALK